MEPIGSSLWLSLAKRDPAEPSDFLATNSELDPAYAHALLDLNGQGLFCERLAADAHQWLLGAPRPVARVKVPPRDRTMFVPLTALG
jgi:hypothetical protein